MPTYNTPSPHRFLAPSSHSAQKPTRPHSSLRNAAALAPPASASTPTPTATPQLQSKRLTPAKRFVVTPLQRTGIPEATKPKEADTKARDNDAQLQHTPLPRPHRRLERVESIEEPSQPSPPDTADEIHVCGVIPSTEDQDTLSDEAKHDEGNEENDEMLFESTARSKRRRMSPPSSPSLQPPRPSTPPAVHNSTSHRFKIAPPRTPAPFSSISSVTAQTSTSSLRPHFILPVCPSSPPKAWKPPPEIFSPSRKHAKYIPGGLASTVSSWIVETASTGFAAQERVSGTAGGREKDHGVKIRINIACLSRGRAHERDMHEVDCYAGGVVFARGVTEPPTYDASRVSAIPDPGSNINILLAGQGGSRGSGGVRVKISSLIGVRAPTWEISVGNEKWLVAVDWVVL